MEYRNLLTELADGVLTITLNRPKYYNALCSELNDELMDVLGSVTGNNEIRGIILTGSEKAFAAGADIGPMAKANGAEAMRISDKGREVNEMLENAEVPVIAAVRGLAVGGGCEIALSCDFRVCGENCTFAFPEVGLGILPGAGGTQRLTDLIGAGKAKEMILLGKKVNGKEAEAIGLSTVTVPDEEVMQKAQELAAKVKRMPAYALSLAKQSINAAQNYGPGVGKLLERTMFAMTFANPDRSEGMNAFFEKRKPQYTHER